MRLRSILWALALCGAGWTPGIILSQEAVKDEPLIVSQAEKSKVAKEAIPTQLPNLLPTPDFKSADKPLKHLGPVIAPSRLNAHWLRLLHWKNHPALKK